MCKVETESKISENAEKTQKQRPPGLVKHRAERVSRSAATSEKSPSRVGTDGHGTVTLISSDSTNEPVDIPKSYRWELNAATACNSNEEEKRFSTASWTSFLLGVKGIIGSTEALPILCVRYAR